MRTMRTLIIVLALALGTPIFLAAAIGIGLYTIDWTGTQTSTETREVAARVIDGDTIDVTAPDGTTQRVRILGINTPEISHGDGDDQCGGREATDHLRDKLPEGTQVTLTSDKHSEDTDRYGRQLRYVETDDNDVGKGLIASGYAYPWKPDSAENPMRWNDYQTTVDAARANQTGSWATCPAFDHSR